MYSKDAGKDQMLMTMERALTIGQKAGFFFLGFLGGIVGILAASLMNINAPYRRKCRREKRMAKGQMLCADGKPVMFGETLYGGDGRDWLIVGIAGAWSYDVYGLHVAHDGKKEKKPLRAEWLVHELTDAGEEVWEKDAANKEALS